MVTNAWCRCVLVVFLAACGGASAGETAEGAGSDLSEKSGADIRMERMVWITDDWVSSFAVYSPGGLHEGQTVTLGGTPEEVDGWLAHATHAGRSEPWGHVSTVTVSLTYCEDGYAVDATGAKHCRYSEETESFSAAIDENGGFRTWPFTIRRHFEFMLLRVVFDGDERSPVTRQFRLLPPTT